MRGVPRVCRPRLAACWGRQYGRDAPPIGAGMSVFSRDHLRVLYVHVPKTGGTSIEFFFDKNGFAVTFVDRGGAGSIVPMMKCSPQHLHAEQLHAIFHVNRFTYSFMTVRNPIDRLVSEYRMRAVMQKSIEDPRLLSARFRVLRL
jgi:hypothetical protein